MLSTSHSAAGTEVAHLSWKVVHKPGSGVVGEMVGTTEISRQTENYISFPSVALSDEEKRFLNWICDSFFLCSL